MPSNYDQICKDNIRRRGEEFDDIGRLISEQLYSDKTHFIYELIQNAEDAIGRRKRNNPGNTLPTGIKFVLYKNGLEFRHFGSPFNTDDVRGITDVLKGTKKEDKTQIGKFGIGFKSVYALTATPEIHSGDEHFLIERYIRPRLIEKKGDMNREETLFLFPFNHKEKTSDYAFNLINEKLRNISLRILLFLKHVTEIEWCVEGKEKGVYSKKSLNYSPFVKPVYLTKKQMNSEVQEKWLVFNKKVPHINSERSLYTEAAFKLINSEKLEIQRIDVAPLIVFFPTKLETRFGFLINGPYNTTASRSDIENNEWNKTLINETINLIKETVLPWLKKNRLLTVSVLETLPINPNLYPHGSMFRPVYEEIRNFFHNNDFLPAADGTFVAGKNAVLPRAVDVVKLISNKQLKMLLDSALNLKWITPEITENKKELYRYLCGWKRGFLRSDDEEMDPIIYDRLRNDDIVEKLTIQFLENQNTDWMINLYIFFLKRSELLESLKSKPILRLENGEHVAPFGNDGLPQAYIAPENDTAFRVICKKICNNPHAVAFLKKLGMTEPDFVDEVVKNVIPKYLARKFIVPLQLHYSDIQKIEKAYATDSEEKNDILRTQLIDTPFVKARTHDNSIIYKKPEELYFESEELKHYFAGNDTVGFVDEDIYSESFKEILKNIGVLDSVRISGDQPNEQGHVIIIDEHGHHQRTINGFVPKIEVDGLENAMLSLTFEKSVFIWNKIAVPNSLHIRGQIETSRKKTYQESIITDELTYFGKMLRETPWLPNSEGLFKLPSELKLDDLPAPFKRDLKLAEQLGMKMDAVSRLAHEAGVSAEDIEILKLHPAEFKRWKDTIAVRISKPVFPERASQNQLRRQEKIAEQYDESPNKDYQNRTRSVRVTQNAIDPVLWLKNYYKNQSNILVCQICKDAMPFIKRDGEYYFEAVECLSKQFFKKEHEAQFLALCPVCAAMYKEFIKSEDTMMEMVKELIVETESCDIPIELGDLKTSIRFVETHICDLKTILEES